MPEVNRFTLEEHLTSLWEISDSLNVILEKIADDEMDNDELFNVLNGMRLIHKFKCEKTFEIFETLIESGKIT